MLQRGDSVPHFDATTVDGRSVSYSTIWQRNNLILVTLPAPDSETSRRYVSRLTAHMRDVGDTASVITRDHVPGIPGPGVLVADRWGEIVYVVVRSDVADLPKLEELLEWIEYLRIRCPECEGEAR